MHTPLEAAQAYVDGICEIVPLGTGSVNATYCVTMEQGNARMRYVLQHMRAPFHPCIVEDICAMTRTLTAADIEVPTLRPTKRGVLALPDERGTWWRLMTYHEGEVHQYVERAAHACSAARLLGRLHAALIDSTHEFAFELAHFQDFFWYDGELTRALASDLSRSKREVLAPLLARKRKLQCAVQPERFAHLPMRIVHGDPKITNIVFRNGIAAAMLDLDTFGRRPIVTDVGDAIRSWCWVDCEDAREGFFSRDRARAALAAYLETAPALTCCERASLPHAAAFIALNLATRYLIDAIHETYFVLRHERYPSLFAQNTDRAAQRLALCESALELPDV